VPGLVRLLDVLCLGRIFFRRAAGSKCIYKVNVKFWNLTCTVSTYRELGKIHGRSR
jgi:hypothetical protein